MTDKKIIHNLIEEEMAEANKLHPLFASPHEAWAVIREEIEELHEEIVAIEGLQGDMWYRIREDCGTEDILKQLKAHAIYAVQEAVQVGAMCAKALDSLYNCTEV